MEITQEYKGFFTKELRNKIIEELHKNDETCFCVYFRIREDIDLSIRKDKRFSLKRKEYGYYYDRVNLLQNNILGPFNFKRFSGKDFSKYMSIAITRGEISSYPNEVIGLPDKYGRKEVYTFPNLVKRTPEWGKASIELSFQYISDLDKKKRRNERILGAILGAMFGAITSQILSYIIKFLRTVKE